MLIATVVGARPQFIKAAAISRVVRSERYRHVTENIIHTGQHYDYKMSDVFFEELGIPAPAVNLKIGSGPQGAQTGAMLAALETAFIEMKPDVVLAYGDTNSTLAAGLSAAKLNIPFIHAEAGERFFRRQAVPEEVNRVVSDSVASLCLTFTERGGFHLMREGVAPERIRFVGDPMYDIFLAGRERALSLTASKLGELGLEPNEYYLSTIHRVENTQNFDRFIGIVDVLDSLDRPAVLPVHPRIAERLRESGWAGRGNLKLIEPQAHSDFHCLLLNCRKCLTDSGGVMRETFFARKPGIIPMINTWWPEIVESGWAVEAGGDLAVLRDAMLRFEPPPVYPEGLFGAGDAAERIVAAAVEYDPGADNEAAWHWQGRVSQLPPNIFTGLTYDAYEALLKDMKQIGYSTSTPAAAKNGLLIRHDIGFDIAGAVPLAEREQAAGLSAVYFVDPQSSAYNVFSTDNAGILRGLVSCGHRIGLLTPATDRAVIEALAKLLEAGLGVTVGHVAKVNGETLDRSTFAPSDGMMIAVKDARWFPAPPAAIESFRNGTGLTLSTDPVWWGMRAQPPQQKLAELALAGFSATEYKFARLSPSLRFGKFADQ